MTVSEVDTLRDWALVCGMAIGALVMCWDFWHEVKAYMAGTRG